MQSKGAQVMTVYVVAVVDKEFRTARKVSQEGYKTLAAAQAFCMSRPGAEKLNKWCFEDKYCYYYIHDVSIK